VKIWQRVRARERVREHVGDAALRELRDEAIVRWDQSAEAHDAEALAILTIHAIPHIPYRTLVELSKHVAAAIADG
jgi:hypothetical protein